MSRAWYNENDPKKAAWLRENIKAGLIADGDVDERSITAVSPGDLAGYTQCHFFAGIGIWSYALRLAGWPDDEPVWTGSCPCQPFSAAGQRKGTEDERHLFPVWFRLIQARRPVAVFGEQVSDGDGLAWLDTVLACMDPEGYTLGVVDTCAAGVGAPHRRQRLYFVAHTAEERHERRRTGATVQQSRTVEELERLRNAGGMAHAELPERWPVAAGRNDGDAAEAGWDEGAGWAGERGAAGELGDTEEAGSLSRERELDTGATGWRLCGPEQAGAVNGFWRDAEWIWCRDGKWRATEPGTQPLAHGAAARILRLRGYGDGIVAPQAAAFVRAYRECRQ